MLCILMYIMLYATGIKACASHCLLAVPCISFRGKQLPPTRVDGMGWVEDVCHLSESELRRGRRTAYFATTYHNAERLSAGSGRAGPLLLQFGFGRETSIAYFFFSFFSSLLLRISFCCGHSYAWLLIRFLCIFSHSAAKMSIRLAWIMDPRA